MKVCLRAVTSISEIVLLSLQPKTSHGQDAKEALDELLQPIEDQSELARVAIQNDYFIKEKVYFAKRYRIVRINSELLSRSSQFEISLFNDVSVKLNGAPADKSSDRLIKWRGVVQNPTYPLSEKQRSRPETLEVTILGLAYDRDIADGRIFASQSVYSLQGYKRSNRKSDIELNAIYGFTVDFEAPATNGRFQITPLQLSPEYHLVLEADPAKSLSLTDEEESNQRRLDYEAYLTGIGEDPRKVIGSRIIEEAKK